MKSEPMRDASPFDAEEFVKVRKPAFKPYASYCSTADAVYVYTKDVPSFHARVDDMFTIMYDKDRQFTGCVVKSVRALWEGRPPTSTTFEAVFEQFVSRYPKVSWSFCDADGQKVPFAPARDLATVRTQELALC